MFTIDKSLCLECGACVKACPAGIFLRDEEGKVYAQQKPCLDCFHCAAVCPAKAVAHDGLGREACYPAPAPEGTLLRTFQKRRSIRHFTDKIPDRALIQSVLDGAAYAPSGHNDRFYRWTVILGRERVEQLRRLVLEWADTDPVFRHLVWADRKGRNPITCGAPCLIFAHAPRSAVMSQTDAVAAATLAEQLLTDQGLGVCWGGYLMRAIALSPEVRAFLDLPEDHDVYAILITGYPAERYPNVPPRPAASIRWMD